MLAFVGLNLYPFFSGGQYLRGIYPLLACPAAAGLAVIALLRLRQKDCLPSQRAVMGLVAAGCAVVFCRGPGAGDSAPAGGLGV